jgi:hypothetical protein
MHKMINIKLKEINLQELLINKYKILELLF